MWTYGFLGGEPTFAEGSFIGRTRDALVSTRPDSEYIDMCDIDTGAGTSGSALIDEYGEVVGVVSKSREGRRATYMVPIPYVRYLLRMHELEFVGLKGRLIEMEYGSRVPVTESVYRTSIQQDVPRISVTEYRPHTPEQEPKIRSVPNTEDRNPRRKSEGDLLRTPSTSGSSSFPRRSKSTKSRRKGNPRCLIM